MKRITINDFEVKDFSEEDCTEIHYYFENDFVIAWLISFKDEEESYMRWHIRDKIFDEISEAKSDKKDITKDFLLVLNVINDNWFIERQR